MENFLPIMSIVTFYTIASIKKFRLFPSESNLSYIFHKHQLQDIDLSSFLSLFFTIIERGFFFSQSGRKVAKFYSRAIKKESLMDNGLNTSSSVGCYIFLLFWVLSWSKNDSISSYSIDNFFLNYINIVFISMLPLHFYHFFFWFLLIFLFSIELDKKIPTDLVSKMFPCMTSNTKTICTTLFLEKSIFSIPFSNQRFLSMPHIWAQYIKNS